MAWGMTEGVRNTGWRDPDPSTWQSGGWYTNPRTGLVTQWFADGGGSSGGDFSGSADRVSQMEAEYAARQAEIERMRRQEEVRNKTDSYLSGRKEESTGILGKMQGEKDKIFSDLQGIYAAIEQASADKNESLLGELYDEADKAQFSLDKYDARARQEIGKIDETNYNNARALNKTDTSMLSNLMSEPGGEISDFMGMLNRTKTERDDMVYNREQAIGEDISGRMADLGDRQTAAQGQISEAFNPVQQQQEMFMASPMSQYMASKDDFNPNKASVDNAYNQLMNVLNTQMGKANQMGAQFGQDNTADSVLEGLVALTDEGRNQLYETGELDKALAEVKPNELPQAVNYQQMMQELAMQQQPNQRKKQPDFQNLGTAINTQVNLC